MVAIGAGPTTSAGQPTCSAPVRTALRFSQETSGSVRAPPGRAVGEPIGRSKPHLLPADPHIIGGVQPDPQVVAGDHDAAGLRSRGQSPDPAQMRGIADASDERIPDKTHPDLSREHVADDVTTRERLISAAAPLIVDDAPPQRIAYRFAVLAHVDGVL